MSDFFSVFWSNYVAIASLGSILLCALLLWLVARAKVPGGTDETTGHI